MAGHGVLFRSAFFEPAGVRSGARQHLYGQYPSRHGVWHNGSGLAEDATTLATTLGQAAIRRTTSANGTWRRAKDVRARKCREP